MDQNTAHGKFSCSLGLVGLAQRVTHEVLMIHEAYLDIRQQTVG